jgi:hypothetical protein
MEYQRSVGPIKQEFPYVNIAVCFQTAASCGILQKAGRINSGAADMFILQYPAKHPP